MALTPVVPAPAQAAGSAIQLYGKCTAEGQEGSARAPSGAILPYCGAPETCALPAEESRLGDLQLHGYPLPAWADVGLASHMRGLGDLANGSLGKTRFPQVLRPEFDLKLFIFRALLAIVTLAENICCWLAYLEVRNPDQYFYNKFEAYAIALPGLDRALAAVAVLNTFYLFAFWVAVVVVHMDIHRPLAMGRLLLSVAMAMLCFIAVFISEGTKVTPFACTLCAMLHVQVLLLGGLLPQRGQEPPARRKFRCRVGIAVFACLSLAWLLMFLIDGMAFLREDACRATKNRAMPVRLNGVVQWQCARWGEKHFIKRMPVDGAETVQALCDASFHDFDVVESTLGSTVWRPSHGAHDVQCPPSCQTHRLGMEVVGCRVYDARSSICAAAVQMGLVDSSTGGLVRVVGRPPPTEYGMCHLRSVLSVRDAGRLAGADLIAARAANANTSTSPGAFYFQEVEGMREHDSITLHGFRRTSRPGAKRPYESYKAEVSWRIGGADVRREDIRLGPAADSVNAAIELNFCHSMGLAANTCE